METIEKTTEVVAPVERVYNQWTQFEDFPRFMDGVEEVRQLDEKHLHWVAKLGGKKKEWDAEIIEQVPDDRIAWRSIAGALNSGVVHFHPKDHDHTVVTLRINYQPEGRMEKLGAALGWFSSKVESDLRRFKEFVQERVTETGAWRGEIHGGAIRSSGPTGTSV